MSNYENQSIKILLVDDNPVNLEIAGKILAKEGYDIYIADSGSMALELIKKMDFDLLLLDIMMPVLDGFETLKLIRNSSAPKNIPIMFVSAKVDIQSVRKAFDLGAVDYIRRPFHELELRARVKYQIMLKKINEELIDKNKDLEEALRRMEIITTTDSLTNLLNRSEILKRIEHELAAYERYQRPFSVILADIDYFSAINNIYGHKIGDDVIKLTADIMQRNTRKMDCISRWGGEEFVIILPDTRLNGAITIAEKLRLKISGTAFGDDLKIKMTMTFGVSEYDADMNISQFISNVDILLHKGKENGRNQVVAPEK